MSEFLYHYHPVEPATWFYLSSLLMIGLFFKFSRFWSVRNLDLILLITLGPGLMFIHYGKLAERSTTLNTAPPAAAADRAATAAVESVGSDAATSATAATAGISNQQLAGRRELLESTTTSPEGAGDPLVRRDNADAAGTPADALTARALDVASAADTGKEADSRDVLPNYRLTQKYGYAWLFCVGVLLLARLLADPTMVRRPLLEPNLSAGGLTFIGCSLFVFLMANVISKSPEETNSAESVTVQGDQVNASVVEEGPGYSLLASLPTPVNKTFAILAHLTVVVGMILIGYRHFDNIIMGVGAATLYLMLPYTALMTNETKHVMPAAALVWAVLCYRRPLTAGMFLGLAGGMTYYPLFLLPLWLSFYWPRGLWRFVSGVVVVLMLLVFVLFSSTGVVQNVRLMFGLFPPAMDNLRGIWDPSLGGWSSYYRIPVLAAFVALACSLTLWPAQKNLGTLLSCSAAVMVATQFWHGYGGGEYMAWYLPLLLLTIFRPNLEDRVALTVLAEGWLPRRMSVLPTGKAAFSSYGV